MPAVLLDPGIPDVATLIGRDYLNGSGVNLNEFGFYIPPSSWGAAAGKMTFYRRIGNGSFIGITSNANSWLPNVWYHVAGVIDSIGGMRLYINGVLQSNTDPSTQPILPQTGSSTDMVAIATWGYWGANSGNRFFNGDIDEIRFWKTARTQTEIQTNMCRKIKPVQPGLNAYYRFDNNSTTTLTDLTGNGYDGTLANIPSNGWHYSSAPLGDTSTYLYPSSFTGQTLSLQYASGDLFKISNVTANPAGAHIYRVASLPNVSSGLTSPLADYYGVFLTNTSGNYDIYEDFSALTSSCLGSCLKLSARENNAILAWTGISPTYTNCTLSKPNESSVGVPYRAEYILSVGGGTLTVSSTSVTCNGGSNGTATTIMTGGTSPYSYSWTPGNANTSGITVPAGTYSVSVTDAQGCMNTSSVLVDQPAPILVTVASATVCSAQTFSITALASGGTLPYTYQWNNTAGGQTFTASVSANATYSVEVIDANGCTSAVAESNITIASPPQIIVGDASICPGGTAVLTATATGGSGNYSFSWLPGNLHGSSISVSPVNATIYTVSLTDGCSSSPITDTGVVFTHGASIPALSLPAPSSGCEPLCVNFNVQDPGNTITKWNWNFGDGSTDTTQSPVHCYTRSGNYKVSLNYGNSSGCSMLVTGANQVTVFITPKADFTASDFETNILEPYISFYNQSVNATSWQWNFGDLSSSALQNPSHVYNNTETYSVTLIANNSDGCSDTITHIVKVDDIFTFYAPNAFSPNDDDMNEQFLPVGSGWDNRTFLMQIFDRWGNLVFSSNDPLKGWKINNDNIPQDTYVWKVSLKDISGKQYQYDGVVSIIK